VGSLPNRKWWYELEGEVRGPVSWDELCELADDGSITPDTSCWASGEVWWPVSQIRANAQGVLEAQDYPYTAKPSTTVRQINSPIDTRSKSESVSVSSLHMEHPRLSCSCTCGARVAASSMPQYLQSFLPLPFAVVSAGDEPGPAAARSATSSVDPSLTSGTRPAPSAWPAPKSGIPSSR